MSWNNRSYFSGQSGYNQYSSSTDVYGGDQHQATGGKKRSSSRLKKSSNKTADEDYPRYTTHDGDNSNNNNNYNSYNNGGYNGYGYGSTPYNNGYDSTSYNNGYNNHNVSLEHDRGEVTSWNNRSYFSRQGDNNQYSSSTDVYGGGQHQATGGKKRSSSRLKKSSSKTADEDYPRYTTYDGDNGNYNNNYNNGGYNGYGSTPYNDDHDSITPYYSGGGGYNNSNSSYSNGGGYNKSNSSYINCGDGYTGGAPIPYNSRVSLWAPQDDTRSPMFINTKELNVYGYGTMPGEQYDNGYSNEQRRRGGGGFFRPVFDTIGHFFDRKFGFNYRD